MNKEEDRLVSFRRWPTFSPVSADRLARAGLYFTGPGDAVRCFSCGGVLENWTFGDDVMKKHRAGFPDCAFVLGQSDNVPFYKSCIESKLHLQLLESIDSGLDKSVSRPTTPCSSVYLFGSRDDIRSSRYGSAVDINYRAFRRKASSVSSTVASDVTDALTDGLDMKIEDNRRRTFLKWTVAHVLPNDLSAAGFFFTGYQDRVRCAFCGGILGLWQKGDNPWTEHQKHFPWCTYGKKGNSSGYSSAQSSPTNNGNGSDICGAYHVVTPGVIPSKYPCSPYLADYQARLSTFTNWPPNRIQTPEHLAFAGFFFTGVNDNVRCFFCDGGLRCWEPQDEAWQEHSKWFPQCPYLLEMKGADFVKNVQQMVVNKTKEPGGQIRQESVPTTPTADEETIVRKALQMGFAQPSVEQALRDRHSRNETDKFRNVEELINDVLEVENKKKPADVRLARPISGLFAKLRSLSKDSDKDVEKLAEENRILKQQRRCKICLNKEVSTVFLPCGHLISCGDCAPSLRSCALCRRVIRGTLKTFLS